MPPIDPATLLAGAEGVRSDTAHSAAVIAQAVALAPEDLDIQLAAYRFYFFTHDYAAAVPHAQAILRLAALRLNIPADPALVRAGDADFTAHEFAPGLYLQALVGLGYAAARSGNRDLARQVLAKAAEIDPSDRFGGAWLLARVMAGDADDPAD